MFNREKRQKHVCGRAYKEYSLTTKTHEKNQKMSQRIFAFHAIIR